MPRLRAVAVVSAALAVLAPGAALAQSAGDDQYQDPFGSSKTTSSAPSTPAKGSGSGGGLSQTPNLPSTPAASGTASAGASSSGTPAPAASSGAAATGQLPATGADPRILALAGLALLLGGLGLRLRTADERF